MQKFLNGVERNQLHPETFEIPSDEEKKEIVKGDFVKVGFIHPDGGAERMWLIVEEITEDEIKARLDNKSVLFDYKINDVFQIRSENILSIIKQ